MPQTPPHPEESPGLARLHQIVPQKPVPPKAPELATPVSDTLSAYVPSPGEPGRESPNESAKASNTLYIPPERIGLYRVTKILGQGGMPGVP